VHVVSVLRGETTAMVSKHGHDKLPTFGVGGDQPAPYWRSVIRQLIAHGALETGSGDYASLKLVPDVARGILRGESTIMLHAERERPKASRTRGSSSGPPPAAGADSPLFEALRQWRTAEAKRQSVPPYVIFHDSVLREIAAGRPDRTDLLGTIRGVGASKLDRYGAAVLAVVAAN